MRNAVLLFVFIFSPVMIIAGSRGKTETDKSLLASMSVKAVPKSVEAIILQAFSGWQEAEATYYDPLDPKQTRENPDGRGAFGRMIKSGSIAFGSVFTEIFRLEKMLVYVQIKDLNIMTPYGLGIFRIDDAMGSKNIAKDQYNIDFFHRDLGRAHKTQGRFSVMFKVLKIEKASQ